MFTNGEISKGLRAQEDLSLVEQRDYVFCRGRINVNYCEGLGAKEYQNSYNAKPIKEGEIQVKLPNVEDGTADIILPAPGSTNVSLIGTGVPVLITKRWLVIEVATDTLDESNNTIYVKLSQSKNIGNDGDSYFTFEITSTLMVPKKDKKGVDKSIFFWYNT